MEEVGWSAEDYLWDPYRLMAVEDTSAASLHAATQELGTQPDSLVAPVLPGPAVPSAAASRANKAKCKVLYDFPATAATVVNGVRHQNQCTPGNTWLPNNNELSDCVSAL